MESRSGTHWKLTPRSIDSYGSLEHPILVAVMTIRKTYTDKQGQYLAFIHYYSKIHGCSPSEAEMQQYFRVSPPSVHQMVLSLEAHGLITRTPGQARSIQLLISRDELPDLV
jgi:DNA-binding MarR family transcriptional regulator